MDFWQRLKDKVEPIKTRHNVIGRNMILTEYEEVGDKSR